MDQLRRFSSDEILHHKELSSYNNYLSSSIVNRKTVRHFPEAQHTVLPLRDNLKPLSFHNRGHETYRSQQSQPQRRSWVNNGDIGERIIINPKPHSSRNPNLSQINPNFGSMTEALESIKQNQSVRFTGNSVGSDSNGSLVIIKATRDNEGRFLCQANNGVGPPLSKVITLTVLGEY